MPAISPGTIEQTRGLMFHSGRRVRRGRKFSLANNSRHRRIRHNKHSSDHLHGSCTSLIISMQGIKFPNSVMPNSSDTCTKYGCTKHYQSFNCSAGRLQNKACNNRYFISKFCMLAQASFHLVDVEGIRQIEVVTNSSYHS